MPITAPVPVLPGAQPAAGSTATLELALAYDNAGVPIASPVFTALPVAGEISLTFSPQNTMYDAYVASGLDAWSYAVKTGMQGTLNWRTAAPGTDTVVGPLIKAGLRAGNAAVALFRLKNGDGTYYSGTVVFGISGTADPVRGIQEHSFTGATSGPIEFTNS